MKNIIELENLHYGYENNISVLKNINLQIQKGEMVALTGKNGSGKTTLSKHLNGLLKPTEGTVFICGLDTKKKTVGELAQKVGYVFQNPDHQIFNDTVYKEIAYGPRNQGLIGEELQKRVENSLKAVNLEKFSDYYPYKLSKGQRQRLAIASVLAMESEIIVLDEPTTGLDYRESLEIMELLKGLNEKGVTIIFISHDMNLVGNYGKRMIVVSQGEIVADDKPRNIFSMEKVIQKSHLKVPLVTELAKVIQLFDNLPVNEGEFFNGLTLMKEGYLNVLSG